MRIDVAEFLAYATQHEADDWTTLVRRVPFRYEVTDYGIKFITNTGKPRKLTSANLESFCEEFRKKAGSLSPGHYPDRWNKSYLLPLFERFVQSRA